MILVGMILLRRGGWVVLNVMDTQILKRTIVCERYTNKYKSLARLGLSKTQFLFF